MMTATMNVRRRPDARPARGRARDRRRAARPDLEGLEDRRLLYATTGGLWRHGELITYSFVPDGTSIGGTPSILFQTLNNRGFTNAAWQLQIQKAAAIWEAVANIQLASVSDDGTAIGASGNQQGDSRFGDIRIGGYSQGSLSQLAFAFLPPPFNGGTAAGDVFFNTDEAWQINGSAYDLETVAIHELGHALGMSHSQDTAAVMYANYLGAKQAVTADDILGIQSIYGAIPADTAGNGSFATAIDVTAQLNSLGQASFTGLRIASATGDVDYYHVTAPANTTGTMTVLMQASNLSSLSPDLLVYNQAHDQILGRTSYPLSYGGSVVVQVPVVAGQGYYIRCQAAGFDPSGVGAYGLEFNFGLGSLTVMAPPNTVVPQQPDQGGGGIADTTGRGHHGHADDVPETITVGALTALGDRLVISDTTPKATASVQHPGQGRSRHHHGHRGHHHPRP